MTSTSANVSSKRVEDQEWESHLIIRFPPDIAQKVRDYLEEDSHHGNESRMNLNFSSNLRSGTVKFDRNEMDFSLYDLPCITEVMKTLDSKTVYKVADISQIVVCSPPGDKGKRDSGSVSEEQDKRNKEYEWPHGLCPPMRNVRKKYFRKIKRKKYMDAADVERELKRLLRSDLEAVSVRWEVISTTDEPEAANDDGQKDLKEAEASSQQEAEESYEYGLSLSESEEEFP